MVVKDQYPVSEWHVLIIPKRHTADYFDLGTPKAGACHRLLTEARSIIREADAAVAGFNVGINTGEVESEQWGRI